jgi:DNA polymerase-1
MKISSELIIVDGSYHLHRFYHGIPRSATLPNGMPVNAVYGFMAYIRRLFGDFPHCKVIVVFDSESGISEKCAEYPEYKGHRNAQDDSIFDQLTIIQHLLAVIPLRSIEDSDHEADDVIASIAAHVQTSYAKLYIASHDHDFFQLLTPTTSVLREIRGRHVEYTPQKLVQELHISPPQYPLYLALTGDPSDNIKGISGIGPKTARTILQYGETAEEIFRHLHAFPHHIQRKLDGHKQKIEQLVAFFKMNQAIPCTRYQLHALPERQIDRHFVTNDVLKLAGFEAYFNTSEG